MYFKNPDNPSKNIDKIDLMIKYLLELNPKNKN